MSVTETQQPSLRSIVEEGFAKKWGILPETLTTFDVQVQAFQFAVGGFKVGIPYQDTDGKHVGTKWRYTRATDHGAGPNERAFQWEKLDGFQQYPLGIHNVRAAVNAGSPYAGVIVCEGETDTMRLTQELTAIGAGTEYLVIGMPGLNAFGQDWLAYLDGVSKVYFCLDNDLARVKQAGYGTDPDAVKAQKAAAQANDTWRTIRATLGNERARRIKLPDGIKDVCEYFKADYTASEFVVMVEDADVRYEAAKLKKATANSIPAMDEEQLAYLIPETGYIRDFVDCFEQTTEAPTQFLVADALCCLAAATPSLRISIGHVKVSTNLYIMLIGKSTFARKSSSMALARWLMTKAGVAKVMTEAGSPEGIETFVTQHPSVVMLVDEFRRLTQVSAKGYGSDLLSMLTSLYGGWASPRILRPKVDKNGEAQEMEEPKPQRVHFNVLGASTEAWLDGLSREHIEGGFLGRHLLVFFNKSDKRLPVPPAPDSEKVERLSLLLKRIHRDCVGDATFTDEAINDVLSPWYHAWMDRIESDPMGEVLGPFWARYDTLARKLAVLLEISQDPRANPVVSADSMRRALAAVDSALVVIEHKLKAGLFGDRDQVAVTRMLAQLQLQERATRNELAAAAQLSLRDAAIVVEAMTEAGQIERYQSPTGAVTYALVDEDY